MKLYTLFAASLLLIGACTDTKKQEKDALNQVIEVHDEAMTKDEKVIGNKTVIDSLLKSHTLKADSASATQLLKELDAADESMESWMHQFNPDNTGKSHEQVIIYMADQKKMITEVNKKLDEAIKSSDQYLRQYKK